MKEEKVNQKLLALKIEKIILCGQIKNYELCIKNIHNLSFVFKPFKKLTTRPPSLPLIMEKIIQSRKKMVVLIKRHVNSSRPSLPLLFIAWQMQFLRKHLHKIYIRNSGSMLHLIS